MQGLLCKSSLTCSWWQGKNGIWAWASLEQKLVLERSSKLGLWAIRTDLHRNREVLGNKESGIQARKLGGQAGGGKGEAQSFAPALLELRSVSPQASQGGRRALELGPSTWLGWRPGEGKGTASCYLQKETDGSKSVSKCPTAKHGQARVLGAQ